jgi:hypothetical protein
MELVVDPLVPTKDPQEPTTLTPAEIIYHRRVQVLDRAGQTSVTEACRSFGVSPDHLLPMGRPRPAHRRTARFTQRGVLRAEWDRPRWPTDPTKRVIQERQPVNVSGDLPSCQLRLVVLPPQRQTPRPRESPAST